MEEGKGRSQRAHRASGMKEIAFQQSEQKWGIGSSARSELQFEQWTGRMNLIARRTRPGIHSET